MNKEEADKKIAVVKDWDHREIFLKDKSPTIEVFFSPVCRLNLEGEELLKQLAQKFSTMSASKDEMEVIPNEPPDLRGNFMLSEDLNSYVDETQMKEEDEIEDEVDKPYRMDS